MRRSVSGDVGVDDRAVNADENVGNDGMVVARSSASFAGDDVSIGADRVDGDAGASEVVLPELLALNLEVLRVMFSPDGRSESARRRSGE